MRSWVVKCGGTPQNNGHERNARASQSQFHSRGRGSTNGVSPDTSADLQQFYDSAKVASLGQLKQVTKEIADSNYTQADSRNSGVYANNIIESNQKEINRLYLLSLTDTAYVYSSADSEAIYNIAVQCPSEGGGGVWDARVLYYSIIDDYWEFEADCEAQGKSLIHHGSKSSILSNDNFKIFPNPNNGDFTLSYNVADNEIGTITIYDIAGKLIHSFNFTSSSTVVTIHENELNAGAYFYEIKVNESKVKMDKLIIIK